VWNVITVDWHTDSFILVLIGLVAGSALPEVFPIIGNSSDLAESGSNT
jgi:hypothetical protein